MSDQQRVEAALDALLAEHDPSSESYEEFRGHQFDAGLAWVQFPEDNGGLGVARQLQKIVNQRLHDAGAPATRAGQFFMYLAGPTIVTHGSDEVKQRFLKPMFTGDERWCQLFSEPGAGSDFAGLGTRAVRDGDEWIVNGQKVWNTLAHIADFGMLVTRTNPELPKHKGMTYFALDMKADGVDVQPLRQITGEAEFNEVFMTDVRIPDAHRIGDVGEGWRAALTTLMNERTAIGGSGGGGGPKRGSGAIGYLVDLYQKHAGDHSASTRDEVMHLWIRAEALRLTNMRAAQLARSGNPGPEGSVGKSMMANLNQDIWEKAVDLQGMAGQIDYDYSFRRPGSSDMIGTGPGYAFLRARANSIEGGTTEVMKNILGEQVLGLPGEPRVDKDIPWIDVPRGLSGHHEPMAIDPTVAPPHTYATYPSLLDRTVFVTGGADGIGAGMVEEFAKQGSKVGFADINPATGAETVARCEALGVRHVPRFYEVDLVDIAATQEAIARAIQDLGGITVLVNNAASDDRHTWQEMTPEYWDDRLNTNLRHYFFAIQAVAPQMIEAQHGSIINIGSSSYMMQEDFFPGYAIAKSGVEGITRTLARTFGPDGVRVNTVLPGWVATERQLTKWWSPEGEEGTLRDQAIKRRIYPAEFAQMVLFLAADDGAACTAQQFLVDGGRR